MGPRAKAGGASDAAIDAALREGNLAQAAAQADVDPQTLSKLADRIAHAKAAVALPPGPAASGSNAVAANAAVLLLNAVVGAVGKAVKLPAEPDPVVAASQKQIAELVAAMRGGQVDVLIVHDANPLYSLSAATGFREALDKVKLVVSFASLADETSEAAGLVLPDHTPLESWGDAAPRAGIRSLVQPTVRPLHDTRAIGDTLLKAARAFGADMPAGSTRDVLEANWGGDFRAALARGGRFGAGSAGGASVRGSRGFKTPKFAGSGEYTLVAYPHSYLGDGSGAALPWLQEIPDPVTKLSWRSWVEVSKATAAELGFKFGDVARIETQSGAVELSRVAPRWRARRRDRSGARAGPHGRLLRIAREPGAAGRGPRCEPQRRIARRLRRIGRPRLPGREGERHEDGCLPATGAQSVDRQPARSRARPGGLSPRTCGWPRRSRPRRRAHRALRSGAGCSSRLRVPLGHGDRHRQVHGLQRVYRRLLHREQHPGGRRREFHQAP